MENGTACDTRKSALLHPRSLLEIGKVNFPGTSPDCSSQVAIPKEEQNFGGFSATNGHLGGLNACVNWRLSRFRLPFSGSVGNPDHQFVRHSVGSLISIRYPENFLHGNRGTRDITFRTSYVARFRINRTERRLRVPVTRQIRRSRSSNFAVS